MKKGGDQEKKQFEGPQWRRNLAEEMKYKRKHTTKKEKEPMGRKDDAKKVDRKLLFEALKDIDDKVELDPTLKSQYRPNSKSEDLVKLLEKTGENLYTTDPISDQTKKTLKTLGIQLQDPPEEPEQEEPEPEQEEPEQEEPEQEEPEKKPAKKDKPASGEKKASPFQKKDYSRPGSIGEVINGMKKGSSISMEDWAKKADEVFVKHGGSSNLKESKFNVSRIMKVLGSIEGIFKISEDEKSITKLF